MSKKIEALNQEQANELFAIFTADCHGDHVGAIRFLAQVYDVPCPNVRIDDLEDDLAGYYSHITELIVLDRTAGRQLRTIVHEFVHHLQYVFNHYIFMLAFQDLDTPHDERPHEIEARRIAKEVCSLITN